MNHGRRRKSRKTSKQKSAEWEYLILPTNNEMKIICEALFIEEDKCTVILARQKRIVWRLALDLVTMFSLSQISSQGFPHKFFRRKGKRGILRPFQVSLGKK